MSQDYPTYAADKAQTTDLAKRARAIADELFKGPCGRSDGERCLEAERARPLTAAERKEGFERRPFDKYVPSHMCRGCEAYWFAEVTAQRLEACVAVGFVIKFDRSGR